MAPHAGRALRNLLLLTAALAMAAACVRPAEPPVVPRYERVTFSALPGWADGRQAAALAALERSCAVLGRDGARPPTARSPLAPQRTLADWRRSCRALADAGATLDDAAARRAFEAAFTPYRLLDTNRPDKGLFTGYFEPVLAASPVRTARFRHPIYGLPPAGARPLPARAAIDGGDAGRGWPVLFWTDDPVALFFLHIQGSGQVRLPDGQAVRVGYAGTNGHSYVAIGRILIERGQLAREDVTMQSIVAWLHANPDRQREILDTNPSYVFFRVLPAVGPGPPGAAGIPLTPWNSIAVDPAFVGYGTPVWVVTHAPRDPATPLRRLMIAQDTGGAIRGPVRGDIFFGSGTEAGDLAGRMASQGSWYLLLPRRGR